LFGFFKKKHSSAITVSGKTALVVSITRNGEVLYTDDAVKKYPRDHLEGKVFEVSFPTQSGNPYFAYYLCDEYYVEVTNPNIQGTMQMAMGTSAFRSEVSQKMGLFVAQYLKSALGIDASKEIVNFSHNRAHTNVLAYIESLDDWYPIQHCDAEGDDASELKASKVNRGVLTASEVIAVTDLSPTG
jgi:hypothetical protein